MMMVLNKMSCPCFLSSLGPCWRPARWNVMIVMMLISWLHGVSRENGEVLSLSPQCSQWSTFVALFGLQTSRVALSTWPTEGKHVLIFSWKSTWPCLTSGYYPRTSCLFLQTWSIIAFQKTDVKPEHDFPSGHCTEKGYLELNFSNFNGETWVLFGSGPGATGSVA